MTTKRRRADIEDEEPPPKPSTRDWDPACVRCARPMPGYKYRFGLCQTCIDREQADLRQLARDLASGTVPLVNPKYLPEGRRPPPGPLWDAATLTPKARAARETLGIPSPVADEVPF